MSSEVRWLSDGHLGGELWGELTVVLYCTVYMYMYMYCTALYFTSMYFISLYKMPHLTTAFHFTTLLGRSTLGPQRPNNLEMHCTRLHCASMNFTALHCDTLQYTIQLSLPIIAAHKRPRPGDCIQKLRLI